MSGSCDKAWLKERIEKTKSLIEAYEDALLQVTKGAQSYTLDSGQTRQSVTKTTAKELREGITELENRLEELKGRLRGGRVFTGRPGW